MNKKLFGNILKIFSAEGIALVIGYFLLLTIAQQLGDEGVGRYGVVIGWTVILTVIADMGLTPLIIRESAAKREHIGTYLRQATTLRIFAIFIFLIAAAILYPFGGNFILVSIALILALTNVINDLLRGALIGLELHGNAAKLRIVERVLFVGAGITTLYITQNILLMFLVVILTNLLIIIPGTILLTKQVPFLSRQVLSKETARSTTQLIRETSAFWIMSVLGRSQRVLDILMLQFFTTLSVVGWYTAGQNIIEALLFIPITIAFATIPTLSLLHKEKKERELKELFHKIFYYSLIIVLPLVTGLFITAEPLIDLLFPEELSNAADVLKITAFSLLLFYINITMGTFLNTIRKQKLVAIAVAGSLIINLVTNFIFIPEYQHIGAAITTVLSRSFVFIFLIIVLSRTPYALSIQKFVVYIAKPLTASLLMIPLVLLLNQIHVLAGVVAGVVVYFSVMFLIRGIDKEEVKELIQVIMSSLTSGRQNIKERMKRTRKA